MTLDRDISDKIRSLFSDLKKTVELRAFHCSAEGQEELIGMLREVADTSDRIILRLHSEESPVPMFDIALGDDRARIRFRGTPGGHEFSSLILAILHSDGKGKMPDPGVVERVRRLKGPMRVRTYVSLSCEICPDVVQALNLMAVLHPDFEHETVDGALAPSEVTALGIQGVPSVVAGDELIHSGKIGFLNLLEKLEAAFGTESRALSGTSLGSFDVAVIGGGPAGASAAIYSARKGLKTALIADRFGGQLSETRAIENMISIPYTEGAELSARLSEHVSRYPVSVFEHRKVKGISGDSVQRVEIQGGETLEAKAVIVATGADWRRLGVPGESEYIGRGVAFCAHCDGPFFRGKKVAVVGGGNSGVEAAIDLATIVSEVILIETLDRLGADEVLVQQLKGLQNASIVTGAEVKRISGDENRVTGIEWTDRKTGAPVKADVDGVFVQIGLTPNSRFIAESIEVNPYGEIVVDVHNRTSKPWIYAAGDVTTVPFKQIIIAMGDGAKAALSAFADMRSAARLSPGSGNKTKRA